MCLGTAQFAILDTLEDYRTPAGDILFKLVCKSVLCPPPTHTRMPTPAHRRPPPGRVVPAPP